MAERRLEREQRSLEMNVPNVEENLYVKSLRNRALPYETRLMTFDSQNITTKQPYTKLSPFDSKNIKTKQPNPRHSKPTKQNSYGVRPKVPPTQSSLKKLMNKSLLTYPLHCQLMKLNMNILSQSKLLG